MFGSIIQGTAPVVSIVVAINTTLVIAAVVVVAAGVAGCIGVLLHNRKVRKADAGVNYVVINPMTIAAE